MEPINIQLYNLFRHDLNLSDNKSLEFMNILDKEYKSGVKGDLAALEKKLNEGFRKVDARFTVQDERLAALDKKIDVKVSDLRTEIHSAKNETNRYILGIFLAILLSLLVQFLKK